MTDIQPGKACTVCKACACVCMCALHGVTDILHPALVLSACFIACVGQLHQLQMKQHRSWVHRRLASRGVIVLKARMNSPLPADGPSRQ